MEWVGLVLLVALVLVAVLALAGVRIPGAELARAIAGRIACAISLDDVCAGSPELAAEYGVELAGLVAEHAPQLIYEKGERQLPIDFRQCREVKCASGPQAGPVSISNAGLPATLFVHVVDCRDNTAAAKERGADCSGERAGNLYLQYWAYYADSASFRGVPIAESKGYHRDDWEGYQVRLGAGGTFARASSHHGYNHNRSVANWGSDAGIGPLRDATEAIGLRERGGWGPVTSRLHVSAGSHAGNVVEESEGSPPRWTPSSQLHLLPLEPVVRENPDVTFEVTPPWRKLVYTDPEAEET